MATKINLLPNELGRGKEALKVAALLNKVSMIIGGIFLLLGIIGIIYLVALQSQITGLINGNSQKQAQIRNLEQTEQKLVLIKDRAGKIKGIIATKSAYDASSSISDILSGLPPEVSLEEANIAPIQVRFSVISQSSLGMIAFLNKVSQATNFKQVILKNFGFRPLSGYSITIETN
ncbi:MAG TPA: hypothetical protein VF185_03425 [Patescibacteria group bacterium]